MTFTPSAEYDRWLASLNPQTIRQMFLDRGCTQVLMKKLSPRQDNDKNQIYVGPDLSDVTMIPSGDVVASTSESRKRGAPGRTKFTAPVDWSWIAPRGDSSAPHAKLIFYPQYPEVRLSGLIQGSPDPPRSLYARTARGQEAGRRLLIATPDDATRVWALLLPPEAAAGSGIDQLVSDDTHGVFHLWDLKRAQGLGSLKTALLEQLGGIHAEGWTQGQILRPQGPMPYSKQNAAGYTLEALCGVFPNGDAQPDYLGWELKAHGGSTPITLFTPAPTHGVITEVSRLRFMELFGSPKRQHHGLEPDRWDFTGQHYVGRPHRRTRMQLAIDGWDGAKGVAASGGIQLLTEEGREAARWSFEKLMNLWKTKHSQTVYVPYERRDGQSGREFRFKDRVFLCQGTSFLNLLRGFEAQNVYYDPGLNIKWVERARGFGWRPHDRHQFRSKLGNVGSLYDDAQWVNLPSSELSDPARVDIWHQP